MLERDAERSVLNLIGLAMRAGGATAGLERVRVAVRGGDAVSLVILAGDASPTQRDKLTPLLKAREVRFTVGFTRASLGRAIGRAPASAVALSDAQLADRVLELCGSASSPRD